MPRGQWAPRRSLSPQKRRRPRQQTTDCVTLDYSISVDSPLSIPSGTDSEMDFQKELSYAEIGSTYCCVGLDDEEPKKQDCMIVPDWKTLLWTLSGMEFIRLGLCPSCNESSDELRSNQENQGNDRESGISEARQ